MCDTHTVCVCVGGDDMTGMISFFFYVNDISEVSAAAVRILFLVVLSW